MIGFCLIASERSVLLKVFETCRGGGQKTDPVETGFFSNKVPAKQVAESEFSIRTPFVFHVITEKQKRAFITNAIGFPEKLI